MYYLKLIRCYYWRAYYKIVGRPKPFSQPEQALIALRRRIHPGWKPEEPKTPNQWVKRKMEEAAFLRRHTLPDPLEDTEL
jgi:hypothetical protein